MKKFLLLLGFLLLSGLISVSAYAASYTMDSLAAGYYTEGNFSSMFLGVDFNNTGGAGFTIQDISSQSTPLGPDFTGNAVFNSPYTNSGNSTIATLDNATDYVSVTLGDFNADRDELYLYAYNSTDVLIASDHFSNPASSYAGTTLMVSSLFDDIAYVEFYGVGVNNNSVFWDNFTFNDSAEPVPEPATIFLLSTGLLGFLRFRNKRG